MNAPRGSVWMVAVVVVLAAVVTGPLVSGVDVTREPSDFGDGTATVADVELADAPALDAGRFGTDVQYLRGPTAMVTVREVAGTPRLVMRVQAPALDYEGTATTVLEAGDRGQRRLSIADHTVEGDETPAEGFVVRTTVRVQSFAGDRVIFDDNVTVGGNG